MRLRIAVPEDLASLTDIYNQAILRGGCTGDLEQFTVRQRSSWYEEHNTPEYPLIVCEADGHVAGYATLSAYRPGRQAFKGVREVSYYVAENYRRQGAGDMLLDGLVKKSEELRLHSLLAVILECNTASRKLLEKHGFELWGRMPDVADLQDMTTSHLYYGRKVDARETKEDYDG